MTEPPKTKAKSKLGAIEKRVTPEIDRVRAQLSELATGGRRILVGPYTSEVGFELLYWIPFLRWAVHEFPELRGRLIVVSRGGVREWCSGLDAEYVDLFDVSSPEELVSRRQSLKQPELTEFESEIVERVERRLGVAGLDLMHPSILFSFYYRAVKADSLAFARAVHETEAGVAGLAASFQPIPRPLEAGPLAGILPDDYVAVRFYFRPSFPDTEENRRFAAAVVDSLAAHTTVALLNTGIELDDHRDFASSPNERVIPVGQLASPADNLHVQTIALSRARAFVGTYGGLSYLAPFLRVPSLAFSSAPEHTHPWHLELAQRVFACNGWAPLLALRPSDVLLVDLATRHLRLEDVPSTTSGAFT